MTDPKALTAEQIDAIWDRFEDAPTLSYRYLVTEAIERATREQTASTRGPVVWVAKDAAEYMAKRRARFGNDNIWVYAYDRAPDDSFMPLYAAPVEQAGSPESSSMDYGGGPFYGVEQAGSTPDETLRRVVCAAIRAADDDVMLGIRHYSRDMHAQMHARADGAKFAHRHDPDQGFVDQFGVYMSREEAYRVASAAGQIVRPKACGEGLDGPKLYSEGLY